MSSQGAFLKFVEDMSSEDLKAFLAEPFMVPYIEGERASTRRLRHCLGSYLTEAMVTAREIELDNEEEAPPVTHTHAEEAPRQPTSQEPG